VPGNNYCSQNMVTIIRSSLKFGGIKGFPSEAQVCFQMFTQTRAVKAVFP